MTYSAPGLTLPQGYHLHAAGFESFGPFLRAMNAGLLNTAWPAANQAFFVPFTVSEPLTVLALWWQNGGTVSGNVDAAIYDESFNRLVSTGSTAQAGASAMQVVDVPDTMLVPGRYFFALALNNTTGRILLATVSYPGPQSAGALYQPAAFPLPNPASPSIQDSTSGGRIPWVGAQVRSVL